jgi:hypothetical protein
MNTKDLQPIGVTIEKTENIPPQFLKQGAIACIHGRMDFSFFTDIKGWIGQNLETTIPVFPTGDEDFDANNMAILERRARYDIWQKFHTMMEKGEVTVMEEDDEGLEHPIVHRVLAVARVPIITEYLTNPQITAPGEGQ